MNGPFLKGASMQTSSMSTENSRQADWNFGSWFGASCGSSIWILLAGALSLGTNEILNGFLLLGIWSLALIIAIQIWKQKSSFSFRQGLTYLVCTYLPLFAISLVILWNSELMEYPLVNPFASRDDKLF